MRSSLSQKILASAAAQHLWRRQWVHETFPECNDYSLASWWEPPLGMQTGWTCMTCKGNSLSPEVASQGGESTSPAPWVIFPCSLDPPETGALGQWNGAGACFWHTVHHQGPAPSERLPGMTRSREECRPLRHVMIRSPHHWWSGQQHLKPDNHLMNGTLS